MSLFILNGAHLLNSYRPLQEPCISSKDVKATLILCPGRQLSPRCDWQHDDCLPSVGGTECTPVWLLFLTPGLSGVVFALFLFVAVGAVLCWQ